MNSEEPRYSVGHILSLLRTGTPVCRILALTLLLASLGIECLGAAYDVTDPVEMGVLSNPRVWAHDWTGMLVSPWIHDGLTHLFLVLINLLFWGTIVEDLLGSARFLILVCGSALVGELVSLACASVPTCGASAIVMAIYGTMALALVLRTRDFDSTALSALPGALILSVLLLGALPLTDARVSAASHFGGLHAGLMLGLLLLPLPFSAAQGFWWVTLAATTCSLGLYAPQALIPRPAEQADYEASRGEAAYADGDDDQAEAHFRQALEYARLDDSTTDTAATLAYYVGYFSYQHGHDAEADARFREAVRYKPEDLDAWTALTEMALERGTVDIALRYVKAEERLNPNDAEVAIHRAKACLLADRLDDAETAVRHALDLKGQGVPSRILYSEVLARLDRADAGREQLEQALQETTDPVPVLVALARLETREGRPQQAHTALEKASQHSNTDVGLSLLQGEWASGQLHLADARVYYRQARQTDGDNPDVLLHLAQWYRDEDNTWAARRCLQLLLRQPAHGLQGLNLRAQADLWLGDVPGASQGAEQAHRQNPHDGDAACLLALVRQAQGDTTTATVLLHDAITESPRDPRLWLLLTEWTVADDPAKASAYVDRARALAATPRDLALVAGFSALAAGQNASALEQARKVLQLAPGDEDAVRLAALCASGPDRAAYTRQLQELEPGARTTRDRAIR